MIDNSSTPQNIETPLIEKRRSIRGENSIIERVNQQLSECEHIVRELEEDVTINGQDVYSFLSEMAQIAAAAEQSIEPLIELEKDIQILKDEFPGYDEMLELDEKIASYHKQGKIHDAEKLESSNSQDLRLFRRRQNEIEERVSIAREYHLAFLGQQRRLSMLQHSLARHQVVSKAIKMKTILLRRNDQLELSSQHLPWIDACCDITPFIPQKIQEENSINSQIVILQSDIDALDNEIIALRNSKLPALLRIEPLIQSTTE
jgi:hypothetical protein